MAGVHFADRQNDDQALCGQEGGVVFNARRIRCDECITLLKLRRRERKLVETAHAAALLLLSKKKKRIQRYSERRRT